MTDNQIKEVFKSLKIEYPDSIHKALDKGLIDLAKQFYKAGYEAGKEDGIQVGKSLTVLTSNQ